MPLLGDIAMIFIHFHTILIIFGLTYKLSAPQCQFLFSAVFVFQVFPLRKLPEKFRKKYIKNQRSGTFQDPEGEPEGGHQGPRRPGGAAPLAAPGGGAPWGRAPPARGGGGGAWAPQEPSDVTLRHIFKARLETLGTGTIIRDLISVPPPPRFQDREREENSSRHPAGGEDHHRDLLHHHGRLPDDA